ncbi:MAG: carbamoyltransferase HypF, partial [Polyangiales bacterium]
RRGAIVAVKGLGGFHLACDASDERAVQRLRERKHRDEKPFAVMVAELDAAHVLAEISDSEATLLTSAERPIVLVRSRTITGLAPSVCPDTALFGLFLPYTPLHHLLLAAVEGPLVMTSANVADEPICKSNEEAQRRLEGIADALLIHDRDIAMRCDDSVARVIGGRPTIMRRSRGFVPRPFQLREPVARPVLAGGADLKNKVCIAVDDMAYFGPHIGNLESIAALDFYEEAIDRLQTILAVQPELLAHDLHPGYLSTRYAKARNDVTLVGVQHHHAHVASLTAEHGVQEPVLGVAFDGTGYGEDGTSWGGEFLLCFRGQFERLATFRPIPLPGGDLAMREVWRIAYALVHDAFDGDSPTGSLPLFESVAPESIRVVRQMLDLRLNAPLARGVGRYFDAFGALALGRDHSAYEGQIAIAWDQLADDHVREAYPFEIDRSVEPFEVDMRPAMRAAVADIQSEKAPGIISARFHRTLIDATVAVCGELLASLGDLPVALTGGVFQNARISNEVAGEMSKNYRVLRHGEVPPGDGGIALGQALIADTILGDKG